MTAMIWKEIRENLHWAVLWLLGMAAAAAVTVSWPTWQGQESLCSPGFQLVMTFGAAAGGALLGLLQILSETRHERWAFLIHRPATRTELFLGKAAGGLILYLPAMGIPLLGAALWAATPGHTAAPFDWRMSLPGIADILTGIVFYFAGLLTGLRPARWYGSRGLPIAAAVPCAILVWAVPEFWQALLIIVGCGAILGLAAWGSFLTVGEYGTQPRPAKPALGLCLLTGLLIVGVVGAAFAANLLPSERGYTFSQYFLDKQGNILCSTVLDGVTVRVTDLNGNEVQEFRSPYARANLYERTLQPALVVGDGDEKQAGYRHSQRFFMRLNAVDLFDWYYVVAEGRIRGYARNERRCIGSLGPDGFAPPGAAGLASFEYSHPRNWWNYRGLLACSHAVYRVDCIDRRVALVFSVGEDDEIRGAGEVRAGTSPDAQRVVVVATRTGIHSLAEAGLPLFTLGYRYVPNLYPNLRVAILPDGSRFFCWYSPPSTLLLQERWHTPELIVAVAADGSQMSHQELPPIRNWCPDRWYDALPMVLVPLGIVLGVAAFSTAVTWFGDPASPYRFAATFQEVSIDPPPIVLLGCALLLVSALVGIVLTLFIARRYAFDRRAQLTWALVGFFAGPAAALTLLALRDWPARETCPSCGRPRVVDRDQCAQCGAPFAPPVADGTEIFDA